MSRIDDLIHQLCPEGVPFVPLKALVQQTSKIDWDASSGNSFHYIDLTSVDRATRRIVEAATIDVDNAPSRAQQVVHAGDVLFGTTRPLLKRFCVIPEEFDGQICSTGYSVLRAKRDKLRPSFLFHLLGTDRFYTFIEANERGASYPAIPDRVVKTFRIPLPSLEVQDEIVRILDTFSALTAELEAELEARRGQYEYYRDVLMSDVGPSADVQALGEIFQMRAGNHIKAAEISEAPTDDKPYPCYGGNGLRGYVSDYNYGQDVLLIGRQGALCGNVHRAEGRIYATEHAVVVTSSQAVDMSWAFHKLTHMNLNQYKSKSAQPGLAVGKIKNLLVPGVPVSKQRHVGKVLDRFEDLTTSLTIGLPAEIEARRKQYEYYRDRLLTFEEALA